MSLEGGVKTLKLSELAKKFGFKVKKGKVLTDKDHARINAKKAANEAANVASEIAMKGSNILIRQLA